MGLSRRAYARPEFAQAKSVFACASRKRNAGDVSDMAVRKAIASGRITVENDGTIDPEDADRAWGSRSDPVQVRPPSPNQRLRAARRVRCHSIRQQVRSTSGRPETD
jgi:hypothetical protein